MTTGDPDRDRDADRARTGDRLLADLRRHFADHAWTPVTVGCSGAAVYRLERRGESTYLKIAAYGERPDPGSDLAAEATRATWLAGQGIGVPQVLDQWHGPDGGWLLTPAVPGRSAAEPWPVGQLPAVVDALADVARSLHALPAADCPFDRTLAVTLSDARHAAEHRLLDLADLDEQRAGWTADRLLAELNATVPADEDVVVCHGDLCLPNVLLDPRTLQVTGLVDLGRVGRADRNADLALLARSLAAPINGQYDPVLVGRLLARYDPPGGVDGSRIAFYQLLDEFG
ncbi:aminoglycoside O-phosphotransferase APH(3')-IIb [Kitasatospora nipponensis]|uniref:Aminoglycoside O-phosphotransferase APH(3')-IIb n=1 Tax=Kitasatospora nipponensis TaxID=258049 RepID=A0ABP4GNX9_9ACTN